MAKEEIEQTLNKEKSRSVSVAEPYALPEGWCFGFAQQPWSLSVVEMNELK